MDPFEKKWRERFEEFARDSECDHLVSGWSDNGLRRRLSLFAQLLSGMALPDKGRVLDLGCGAGTYVRFLAAKEYGVVGMDYSGPSLLRALNADPDRTGRYTRGEAYCLPFRDECFDLVVSIGVLQALGNPEKAFEEISRVLRPGGFLVIEFLNAFEFIAIMKSANDRIRGRAVKVRTYSMFKICSWLERRGIRVIRRSGVFLPPRAAPWLGKLLDTKKVVEVLELIPGISLAVAHAFLVVGRKETSEIVHGVDHRICR